jgi:hypothetical protein
MKEGTTTRSRASIRRQTKKAAAYRRGLPTKHCYCSSGGGYGGDDVLVLVLVLLLILLLPLPLTLPPLFVKPMLRDLLVVRAEGNVYKMRLF